MSPRPSKPRRKISGIVTIAVAAALSLTAGVMLFAWSGLYSVAASEGHFAVVDKFLRFGMQSSVRTHAYGIQAPDLSDPDLLPLGAGHYYGGCMPCHGAPGHRPNAVFQQSLPPPPGLATARDTWRDRELFWLVKHGLKYTGMPGWSARDRNDEQWALVAFLKRLPDLSKGEYEALALGGYDQARVVSEEPSKTFGADIAQCARCHGDGTTAPTSQLIPRLQGQSTAYLLQALDDYATGARQSGVMQPIASTLSEEQKKTFATHYASVPQSKRTGSVAGLALAASGDVERGSPACDSCHGPGRHETYPSLAGQSQKYLVSQLRLWRDGIPRSGPLSPIMAPIALKLTDADIEALTAHYASSSGEADETSR